jgi:hypothetical protein
VAKNAAGCAKRERRYAVFSGFFGEKAAWNDETMTPGRD